MLAVEIVSALSDTATGHAKQSQQPLTESSSLLGRSSMFAVSDVAALRLKTVLACVLFMACSASMALVNKLVVITFRSPITILDLQLAFGAITLGTLFFHTLHFGSKQDVVRYVKLQPLLYSGVLASSMLAQLHAPVGLQVAIRNLGPLIALPIERLCNEPVVADKWTWAALLYILAGIALYVTELIGHQTQGTSELLLGIGLMLLNLSFAVADRVCMRKLVGVDPVDLSKTAMLLLNNSVAILPVSLYGVLLGSNEIASWNAEWRTARPRDYALLILSGICGLAIGWTGINAQRYVTATTMLVLTNLNKVVVVTIGIIFLGDEHGALAIIGIIMALSGGVWYAVARRNVDEKAKNAALR